MQKKKKAAKTEKKKRVEDTHGKCMSCPATWGPATDTLGWEMDKRTNRWISCPPCYAYRRAIKRAKEKNYPLYRKWLSCSCGAYDHNLNLIRPHNSQCNAAG